jgi:methyl coenzyme M reductase subunit C-like uncharacterized protein (methanogenesis marker protein 7)
VHVEAVEVGIVASEGGIGDAVKVHNEAVGLPVVVAVEVRVETVVFGIGVVVEGQIEVAVVGHIEIAVVGHTVAGHTVADGCSTVAMVVRTDRTEAAQAVVGRGACRMVRHSEE